MASLEQRGDLIRESANYIWSLVPIVRKETNGIVYKGYRKNRGCEPRLIKVLHKFTNAQENEFSVLKNLDHENIVRLLSKEKVPEVVLAIPEVVLVMEYCNGSDLLTILNKPENAYGLNETDFLCLLKDLASGMEHLRANKIVHRDINPHNIIQHHSEEDGRCIFKLSDFGVARQLEEDDAYQSFYGEIDYQFPDMYESIALGLDCIKDFSAQADLWSIGVTLYQAATGHLPFQPYGGARRNQKTMLDMTKLQKKSSYISCSQDEPDGPLNYSSSLPDTCSLSIGLRTLLVPLLAALLESDSTKIMKFDEFFAKVKTIVTKIVIHVFGMSECELMHVYCDHDVRLPEFVDAVRQQVAAGVEIESRDLHFHDLLMADLTGKSQDLASFPITTPLDPVFLFPRSALTIDAKKEFSKKMPKCPELKEDIDIMKDFNLAKRVCKELCFIKQAVMDLGIKHRLMEEAIKKQKFLLQQSMSVLLNFFQDFESLRLVEFVDRIQTMLAFNSIFHRILPENVDSSTEFKSRLESALEKSLELQSETKELRSESSLNEPLLLEHHEIIGCNCEKSIESRLTIASEITSEFEKKVHQKEMEKCDEKQHLLQKQKLRQCFESVKDIHDKCSENLEKMYRQFLCEYQKWSRIIESLNYKRDSLLEKLKQLTDFVDELTLERKLAWEKLCKEHNINVMSRSQLLESVLFKDSSYHKIIGNEFAFPVSPFVYKELLEAGVLAPTSHRTSLSQEPRQTGDVSLPEFLQEASQPFSLIENHPQ